MGVVSAINSVNAAPFFTLMAILLLYARAIKIIINKRQQEAKINVKQYDQTNVV